MKCSVIILNWNGAEMLQRYLPSVVEHTQGEGIEAVVADNGSTDKSLEVLSAFPSVRQICLDKNYGFAEGYNRAIAQVDSEYVVLLNSDVEVTANWLTPLLDFLDTHPRYVACQPKIRSWLKREYFEYAGAAGGEMSALGYPYCRGRIFSYVAKDKGQYDSVKSVFWASGACMLIRTQAYKDAGGLDADFFAHQEEIDLCWRLRNQGWQIACVPQSIVYHLGGGSLHYESPRKTFLNFRNNLLMLHKNLPKPRLYAVLFVRFFLDYAAAAMMFLTGKSANAKAVYEARREVARRK